MKKILLSELTLREKIAQCLCIPQFDLNNKTEVDRGELRTEEERDRLITEEQYGVVWCHGGQRFNALDMAELNWGTKVTSKEYKAWVKSIEKNMKIPSLRTLDAESAGAGGTFSDLTKLCASIVVGATGDEKYAYELGKALGKEFKCAGLNWKWGPVVDISGRFSASVTRGFCQNPDDVIRFANAHIRGLQSVGVAATAKHFPGCSRFGSPFGDSHFTPTMLTSTMEEWWEEQGKIFKGVIDGGVYTIMTSHKSFPACDDTKIGGRYIPSTLSKKVTTDLLKGELGFKGVVITDCINMAGLVTLYPHDELIVEIMKAGNDVILSCDIHDAEILEKAVLDGRLEESRIDDACQRVLDLKEKLGLFDDDYSIDSYEPEDIVPYHKELNYQVAQKGITLIRDNNNMLPLDKNKIKNVQIIVSTHRDGFVNDLEVLKEELEKRGMNVKMQRRLTSFAEIKQIAEENDLIIYAGYLAMHNPKGAMAFFGQECETFHFAFSSGKEKSMGVSFGYPYIHQDFMGNSDTFINAYNRSPEMMKAFADCIFGEVPITGKSPVPLKPARIEW